MPLHFDGAFCPLQPASVWGQSTAGRVRGRAWLPDTGARGVAWLLCAALTALLATLSPGRTASAAESTAALAPAPVTRTTGAPTTTGPQRAPQALQSATPATTGSFLYAWGSHESGECGTGKFIGYPRVHTTPVVVHGLRNVVAVDAAGFCSFAVASDGTVWAWGNNHYRQLALNDSPSPLLIPEQVQGLPNIVAIAAGYAHSLALAEDGQVWAWGRNEYGAVGTGEDIDYYLKPVPVPGLAGVRKITACGSTNLALKSDGTVWAWGDNLYKQLGLGIEDRSVSTPTQINGLTDIVDIALGGIHGVAIRSDGSVFTWGTGIAERVGLDPAEHEVSPSPLPVVGLENVTAAACCPLAGWKLYSYGTANPPTLFLHTDGTVSAVGRNVEGELGVGDLDARPTPVPIPGISGVKSISLTGFEVSERMPDASNKVLIKWSAVAVRNDGTLWSWGGGETDGSLTPKQVPGLSGVRSASIGSRHCLFLMATPPPPVWEDASLSFRKISAGDLDGTWLPERRSVEAVVTTHVSATVQRVTLKPPNSDTALDLECSEPGQWRLSRTDAEPGQFPAGRYDLTIHQADEDPVTHFIDVPDESALPYPPAPAITSPSFPGMPVATAEEPVVLQWAPWADADATGDRVIAYAGAWGTQTKVEQALGHDATDATFTDQPDALLTAGVVRQSTASCETSGAVIHREACREIPVQHGDASSILEACDVVIRRVSEPNADGTNKPLRMDFEVVMQLAQVVEVDQFLVELPNGIDTHEITDFRSSKPTLTIRDIDTSKHGPGEYRMTLLLADGRWLRHTVVMPPESEMPLPPTPQVKHPSPFFYWGSGSWDPYVEWDQWLSNPTPGRSCNAYLWRESRNSILYASAMRHADATSVVGSWIFEPDRRFHSGEYSLDIRFSVRDTADGGLTTVHRESARVLPCICDPHRNYRDVAEFGVNLFRVRNGSHQEGEYDLLFQAYLKTMMFAHEKFPLVVTVRTPLGLELPLQVQGDRLVYTARERDPDQLEAFRQRYFFPTYIFTVTFPDGQVATYTASLEDKWSSTTFPADYPAITSHADGAYAPFNDGVMIAVNTIPRSSIQAGIFNPQNNQYIQCGYNVIYVPNVIYIPEERLDSNVVQTIWASHINQRSGYEKDKSGKGTMQEIQVLTQEAGIARSRLDLRRQYSAAEDTERYSFSASVDTAGEITACSLRAPATQANPDGEVIDLPLARANHLDRQWAIEIEASTAEALQARFPVGGYVATVTMADGSTRTTALSLDNPLPPAAALTAPVLEGRKVDYTKPLPVAWEAWQGCDAASDTIDVTLLKATQDPDMAGEVVWRAVGLSPSTNGALVPSSALGIHDAAYILKVEFISRGPGGDNTSRSVSLAPVATIGQGTLRVGTDSNRYMYLTLARPGAPFPEPEFLTDGTHIPLPEGEWVIRATREGYIPVERTVTVVAGELLSVVLPCEGNGNEAPTASVQEVPAEPLIHSWVTLDGSASYDPDEGPEPLQPIWEVYSKPEDASVVLDQTDPWRPRFKPTHRGRYQFKLIVTDGDYRRNAYADFDVIDPDYVEITSLSAIRAADGKRAQWDYCYVNDRILVDCEAWGGATPLRFQYHIVTPDGSTLLLRDWNGESKCEWTPLATGTHTLVARAKATESPNEFDAERTLSHIEVTEPLDATALRLELPEGVSRLVPGTTATLTLDSMGGVWVRYSFHAQGPDGVWRELRDYSSISSTQWMPDTTGKWNLAGWVKEYRSDRSRDDQVGMSVVVHAPPVAATGVAIAPSASPGSDAPALVGAEQTITASATGGTDLRYAFYIQAPGGGYELLRDYAPEPIVAWTPTTAGRHDIAVWVKDADSTLFRDDQAGLPVAVEYPTTELTDLAVSAPSPQPAGTALTITASATGANLRYKFFIMNPTGLWSTLRDYAPEASVAWTPTDVGRHQIAVWARREGSLAESEDRIGMSYRIDVPPVALTDVSVSQPAPRPVGSNLTISATATGADLRYQFHVKAPSGGYTALGAYSDQSSVAWTPAESGLHEIAVWVKHKDSSASRDDQIGMSYDVGQSPVLLESIQTSAASSNYGNEVTITLEASGGATAQNRRFRCWVQKPGGAWLELSAGWSASNSFHFTPGDYETGFWQIAAWAKDVDSTRTLDSQKGTSYLVTAPPVRFDALDVAPEAPVATGTTVTITATASGGGLAPEYRFYTATPAGTWTMIQDYGADNTATFTPNSAGTWQVAVWVRDPQTGNTKDAQKGKSYRVQ